MPETETVGQDEYRIDLKPSQGGWAWVLRLHEPYRYAFLAKEPGVWAYVTSHWAYTRWGALHAARKAARKHTKKQVSRESQKQQAAEIFFTLSRTPRPKGQMR